MEKNIYVLNSAILAEYGRYEFKPISVEEAKELLKGGFVSAIGHPAISSFLSKLFGVEIPMNRIEVKLMPGEKAIVYKLNARLPYGRELSVEELEKLPYLLGLLVRLE